jgi:Uma2 family endonuclease
MPSAPGIWVEDELLVPPDIDSLEAFRRWCFSEDFPQHGRIDYLHGAIEVNLSPEELQTHSLLKGRLGVTVEGIAQDRGLGQTYIGHARFKSVQADLSCEPDVLFVSWEALRTGRVRYLPASPAQPERLMEVDGAADLAVEVVSKSSVRKDTERLPPLYAAAGVRELWLADARGEELRFQIFHLRAGRYVEARPDAGGFRLSRVLGRRLRLVRKPGPVPATWIYKVEERPARSRPSAAG